MEKQVKFIPCNACGKKDHIIEALYCARCGTKLDTSIKYS